MSDELSNDKKWMVKKTRLSVSEVQQLKTVIQEKHKKIEELERRLNELVQCTSMDDLVVSGLVTTHCSYAKVTATSC